MNRRMASPFFFFFVRTLSTRSVCGVNQPSIHNYQLRHQTNVTYNYLLTAHRLIDINTCNNTRYITSSSIQALGRTSTRIRTNYAVLIGTYLFSFFHTTLLRQNPSTSNWTTNKEQGRPSKKKKKIASNLNIVFDQYHPVLFFLRTPTQSMSLGHTTLLYITFLPSYYVLFSFCFLTSLFVHPNKTYHRWKKKKKRAFMVCVDVHVVPNCPKIDPKG